MQDILTAVMIRREHHTLMFDQEILELPEIFIKDRDMQVDEIELELATGLFLDLQVATRDFKEARKQKKSLEILLAIPTRRLTMKYYGRTSTSHALLVAHHLQRYLGVETV